MLGISYKGTAIPLVWTLLDKRGNSNTAERIELIETFQGCLNEVQRQQVKCLLADREFIGSEWIACLKKQSFTFVIRIRANTLVRKIGKHKERLASTIFTDNHFKILRKERVIWGQRLFIAGQ